MPETNETTPDPITQLPEPAADIPEPDLGNAGYFDNVDWKKSGHSKFAGVDEEMRLKAFESQHRDAWEQHAEQNNLSMDPDDPQQQYDSRAAFAAGDLKPDGTGHLPSKYKLPGHERLILPAGEVFPQEVIDSGFLELDTVDGMGPPQRVPIDPDTPIDTRTSRPAMKEAIDLNRDIQSFLNAENREHSMPSFGQRMALQQRYWLANPDDATLPTDIKNRRLKKWYEQNGFVYDPSVEEGRLGRSLDFEEPTGPLTPEQQLERDRQAAEFEHHPSAGTMYGWDANHEHQLGFWDTIKESLRSLGDPMSNSDARIADRHMRRLQGSTEAFINTVGRRAQTQEGKDIVRQYREVGMHQDLAIKSGFSLEGAYIIGGMALDSWTMTLQNTADWAGVGGAWIMDMEPEAQVLLDDIATRTARHSEDMANVYEVYDSDFFLDASILTGEIALDLLTMGATRGTRFVGKKITNELMASYIKAGGKKATKTLDQLLFTASRGGPGAIIANWALRRKAKKHALGELMDPATKEGRSLYRRAYQEGEIEKFGSAEWLAKKLSAPVQGYNPFVTRMFGNASAQSIVNADLRAKEQGRGLSASDITWALMDGTNMAVATWLLHATGTIPKYFGKEGSKGLFGGIPKSLRQAITTSTLRSAKYGVQGGLGFLAYEAVIDSWHFATNKKNGERGVVEMGQIIDLIDSMATLADGRETDEHAKEFASRKFHSFMLGAVQKWIFKFGGVGGKDSAMRQYLHYSEFYSGRRGIGGTIRKKLAGVHERSAPGTVKRGLAGAGAQAAGVVESATNAQAAARAWRKLTRPQQEEILANLSEAQRLGLRDRVAEEIKMVHNGELRMDHLSDQQLMDIIALGDKALTDSQISMMSTRELNQWSQEARAEGREVKWRETAYWRTEAARKRAEKEGRDGLGEFVGVTKAMARAELARRGHPMQAEVLRTLSGKGAWSVETRAERDRRLEEREIALDFFAPERKPAAADIKQIYNASRLFGDPSAKKSRLQRLFEFFLPTDSKARRLTTANQVELYRLAHAEALQRAVERGDTRTIEQLNREKSKYFAVEASTGEWVPKSRRQGAVDRYNLINDGITNTRGWQLGADAVYSQFMAKRGYRPKDQQAVQAIVELTRANPELTLAICDAVRAGKNTPESPVLSRKDFAAIVGKVPKKHNSAANRFYLAEIIAQQAKESVINRPSVAMAKSLRLKNLPPARTRFAPEETTSEMLQTHLERETVKDRQRQEREAKEVTEEVAAANEEVAKDIEREAEYIQTTEGVSYEAAVNRAKEVVVPKDVPEVQKQLENLNEPTGRVVQDANWKQKVLNGINSFLSELGLKEGEKGEPESSLPYRVILDTKDGVRRPNYSVVMERARDRGVSVAFVEVEATKDQFVPTKTVTEEGVIVFNSRVDPLTAMTAVGEHIALTRVAREWKDQGLENPLNILRNSIKNSDEARDALVHFVATRNPELASAPYMKNAANRSTAIRYNFFGGKTKVDGQEVAIKPMNGLQTDIGRLTFLTEALQVLPPEVRGQIVRANQNLFSKFFMEMRAAYEDLGWSTPLPAKEKKGARNIFGTQKANNYVQDVATFGQERAEKMWAKNEETGTSGIRPRWGRKAMVDMFDVMSSINADARQRATHLHVQRQVARDKYTRPREPWEKTKSEEFEQAKAEARLRKKERTEEENRVFDENAEGYRNAAQGVLLHDGKKYVRKSWQRLEDIFPDIKPEMGRAMRRGESGDIVRFDHDGHSFYLMIGTRTKNGKKIKTAKAIGYVPHEAEAANAPRSVLKMSDREFVMWNKLAEMAYEAQMKHLHESPEKPLDPEAATEAVTGRASEPPSAPPEAPGAAGEAPTPPRAAAEPTKRRTKDLVGLKAVSDRIERILGPWVRDPLSRALTKHDDNYRTAIEDFIDLDLRYNGIENTARLEIERGMSRLARTKRSDLVEAGTLGSKNIKSKDLFAEILDSYIEPTDAFLNNHHLTKGLLKAEKDLIKQIKVLDENLRQELIKDHRLTARVRLENAGKASRVAEMLNEEFDAKVELIRDGRKIKFKHNEKEFTRDEFIEYAVSNIMVPESWGKKYSHFPHLFHGRYRIEITARQGENEPEIVAKGGSRRKRDSWFSNAEGSEYRLAVEDARKKVEELKSLIENPEDVTFDFRVTKIQRALPTETLYLPKKARRRIEKAAKEHIDGVNNTDLIRALSAGVRTRPTPKPFFSSTMERSADAFNWNKDVMQVMAVYLGSHYRYMKGREFQKTIDPKINEIEMYDPNLAKDLRDLSRHILYSDRGFIADTLAGGETEGLSRFIVKSAQTARAAQFYRHLLRPAQHIINSTQATQVATVIGSANMLKFTTEYNTNKAMRERVLEEYGSFDAYGKWKDGKFGDIYSGRMVSGLEKLHFLGNKITGGKWNASSEARNQNIAFYNLFRHAEVNMGKSPEAAAKYARIYGQVFTQYRFTKANDPKILRGQVAKTLGQFKRFQIQSLGLGWAYLRMDKATRDHLGINSRKSAFATWMMANMAFAGWRGSVIGVAGSMGIGLTRQAYNSVASVVDEGHIPTGPWFGEDPGVTYTTTKKMLPEELSFLADIMAVGVTGPFGADLAGSFNLIELPYAPSMWESLARYGLGPTGSMIQRIASDVSAPQVRLRPFHNRFFTSLIESGAATKAALRTVEAFMYWDVLGESQEFQDVLFGSIRLGAAKRDKTGALNHMKSRETAIWNALGAKSLDESTIDWMRMTGITLQEEYNAITDKLATIWRSDPARANKIRIEWNSDYGAIPGLMISEMDLLDRVSRKTEREFTPRFDVDLNRRVGSWAETYLRHMQEGY